MKRLRNNGIWVVVLALLLAAFISVGSIFVPNLVAPASRALGVLGTPFRALAGAFADRVEAAYDYAFRYQAMENRLEELEAQVAEMADENRTAEEALAENERLRELLELRQARTDLVFESARITGHSANSWESTYTISKGTTCGIQVNMCAVTEHGYLVGVVTEAGPNWATIATVLDPSTSIGATVEETGDAAILTSDLDDMSQGYCRLSYVDAEAELSAGDTVLTSGLGGVFPAGIAVGTIVEEGTSTSGMERYATIKPSAQLDELEQVVVIKAFDIVD